LRVIEARNVHQALRKGLILLRETGALRGNRNSDSLGQALVSPVPVATVYSQPLERVVFWEERDANPFLHLYESLWMLSGRNDVAPLLRYSKQFAEYSDDGVTQHGAYGRRWRAWFTKSVEETDPDTKITHGWLDFVDQLPLIADRLRAYREDRRCVLQMWDPSEDLGRDGKDVPCNLCATFQVNHLGQLDLVVFCRSNDVVWGAYGANAVHFSFLLEYVSVFAGLPVGTYTQVSVNWHGYQKTLAKCWPIADAPESQFRCRYTRQEVFPMVLPRDQMECGVAIAEAVASEEKGVDASPEKDCKTYFGQVASHLFLAHALHKAGRTEEGLCVLQNLGHARSLDFVVAAQEWLRRRFIKGSNK